jgi:hypothetical protein
MFKFIFLTALAAVSLHLPLIDVVSAESYRLDCTVPQLPVGAQRRPIDSSCPNQGNSDRNSPKGKQNMVKNNLCSAGDPIILSFSDFMSLQRQAEQRGIPFGADGFGPDRVEHLPQDRSELSSGNLSINGRPIREGDKVQIVAFMDDPHPADLGAGENVNCNNPDAPENDIHINLVEAPAPPKPLTTDSDSVKTQKRAARNAALCKAVVAEIIPHFRPDKFDTNFLTPIAKRHMPVRISGQLFFDASHRPCNGLTPQDSSVRGSLWEIHPIYSIHVCKHAAIAQCPADVEDVWASIDQWVVSGVVNLREFEARTDSNLEEEDHSDRKGEHEGE